ncbi:MAG: OB-fold nucleic acid binding domain-containing protein, partial [Bacteroidia bacterium]|nr:OB-fold nucleic acid binding domain-containing protein [Bacteroidia bacterium]
MKRNKIKDLFLTTQFNQLVVVKGWVRTKRDGKKFSFLALNDGSCIHSLQIVIENQNF